MTQVSHSWDGLLGSLATVRETGALLPQYVAVKAGLRKSLDDWIAVDRLQHLCKVLDDYGLVTLVDCIFSPIPDGSAAVGAQYAPTTRAIAIPWQSCSSLHNPTDLVHIVVAARKDFAEQALDNAWYPLVVHDRVIRKPLKDHQWLGEAFGYPACCVAAFLRDNDWNKTNMYAEAEQRSLNLSWKTNCFPKLTPWTTVFHMPCSFDCVATIAYSDGLEKELRSLDRPYMDKIERMMREPILSLSERSAFSLHGAFAVTSTSIHYRDVTDWYSATNYRRPSEAARLKLLKSGDHLLLRDGLVIVALGQELRGCIQGICDEDIVEIPKLLIFD